MRTSRATAAVLLAALLAGGCAQLPRPSVVGEQERVQIPERPLPQANGSIYQSRQGFQPLFEDRRPRMVGDILTVVLNEQVSASKNAAANASRNGSASLTPSTEFIRFSGVVNPRAITVQNTVPSTQVADARIEYVGDGYINEAQTMGWLQRFFLNISPF